MHLNSGGSDRRFSGSKKHILSACQPASANFVENGFESRTFAEPRQTVSELFEPGLAYQKSRLLERARSVGSRIDNPRTIKAPAAGSPGVLLEHPRCVCPYGETPDTVTGLRAPGSVSDNAKIGRSRVAGRVQAAEG
jgi:hypothetical protein